MREWQARAAEIADALRREARPASVVRDGEHQQLLWNELREAQLHLVVASDQANDEVVSQRFLDALLRQREPARRTALVYTRVTEALHAEVEARCATSSGLAIRCGASGGSHAKVMLADHRAVITSFNFLSFDGDYEGDGRYDLRSEVGVQVRDLDVVAQLSRKLSRALPSLEPILKGGWAASQTPAEPAARTVLTAKDASRLQKLLTEVSRQSGQGERWSAIREWVREGRPWHGVQLLEEIGFKELPKLITLALREHEDDTDEDWRRWLLWWTEHVWHDERSAVRAAAALSRLGIASWSARLPPSAVARLQWETLFGDPLATAFEESVLEQADIPEMGTATGLLALGLQLLVRGTPVDEPCTMIASSAGRPLGRWLELLKRFREVAWQRPVPMDAVRARASSLDKHRASEEVRGKALGAIQEAAMEGLWNFLKGRETRPFLFDLERPIGILQTALVRADVPAVRAWLHAHRDLEDLLDCATVAGLKELNPELTGGVIVEPRRTSCTRRLRTIRSATRDWIETDPQQLPDGDLWTPTVELARGMRESAPEFRALVTAAVERRTAEAPLLLALADLITPLLTLEV